MPTPQEEEEKKKMLHAKPDHAALSRREDPKAPRRKFEQAAGADLGDVRVHSGTDAVLASAEIGAPANPTGVDFHFNQAQHDPKSFGSGGQRLLAYKIVHIAQHGSSPTLHGKLIQLEGESGAPSPPTGQPGAAPGQAATAAPTTVNTIWNINFIDEFRGTGQQVVGRQESTSLYIRYLRIAPEGIQGQRAPVPKVFSGATLGKAGRAEMGGFAHPVNMGGTVSSSIAYGDRPRFDFSIKTAGYDPKTASKDEKVEAAKAKAMNAGPTHLAIVRELTAALDDFVDEAEAQATLSRIVNQHFESIDVEATIKMTGKEATKPINPLDFKYATLTADKTFNLLIKVPNATKDKTATWHQQKGGKVLEGEDKEHEKLSEKGTLQKSAVETEFMRSFDTAFKNELRTAAEKVRKNSNLSENSTTHTGSMTVDNSSKAALAGDIKGHVGLGDLLSTIPIVGRIGKYLGDLLKAEVDINLKPDLSDTFTLSHVTTDAEAKKTVVENETTVRNELATAMTASVENHWSTKMKTQLETQVHETARETDRQKKTAGSEQTQSTDATTTSGTVTVVANAPQPVLVEE
jgi:hypothetical protein